MVGARDVTIHFHSPLLILRTPVSRKDTLIDGEVFDVGRFFAAVARTMEAWFPELLPDEPAEVAVAENHLVRADVAYPKKRLLGACGRVVLRWRRGVSAAWAQCLVLAGILGVGKATAMGQGRFRIDYATVPRWPPAAAETLMARAAAPGNLSHAREALRDAGPAPGVDGVGREEFLEALTLRVPLLRDQLRGGEVTARSLRGVLLTKPSGGLRGLTIPTMEDRFLQRACTQELYPAVDQLLEDESFGYRRGLSRRHARRSVDRARDEGFVHVLDADIRSFFDSVHWGQLHDRLSAWFGEDPIVAQLMAWVRAPVEYAGRTIARVAGLPQGAVMSPMLANLYLDAFDEAMKQRGFRLVRYGDDFVVMCRAADDVARARDAAREELERLALSLHEEKTKEASFEKSFDFLGYLFCRSLIVEQRSDRKQVRVVAEESWEADPAAPEVLGTHEVSGWLRGLELPARAGSESEAPTERWSPPLASGSRLRRPVYVVSRGVRLTGGKQVLRIYDGDDLRDEIPWNRISEISVIGGRQVASSVYQRAMRHRVPVAFYNHAGKPLGMVLPDRVRTPSPTAKAQWEWGRIEERRLRVARSLVEAKIHNHRLLVRYQKGDWSTLRDELARHAKRATRASSVSNLRGIEGQAANAYFHAWPQWVGDLEFPGRSGRGATDPVNAVLNLLYTQLFRQCWLAAIGAGLDAWEGVYHIGRGRYAALAADLQEPFRVLCDRLVLRLIHQGVLTQDSFTRHEKRTPEVRLTPDALRRVINDWESRLTAKVGAAGINATYGEHIHKQADRLAAHIRGETDTFLPFRLKW